MSARDRLIKLLEKRPDVTATEAAGLLGVSKQRVSAILASEGLSVRDGRQRLNPHKSLPKSPDHYDANLSKLAPYLAAGINEMKVAIDLLVKGFDVYKSLIGFGRCDLIAVKRLTGEVLKIEVKSAWRTASGRSVHNDGKKNDFDVMALVFRDGSIEYKPEILG